MPACLCHKSSSFSLSNTLAHNGTSTHKERKSPLMCTEPRLSRDNACAAEHASITEEKVTSDSVLSPFFGVADSAGITQKNRKFK